MTVVFFLVIMSWVGFAVPAFFIAESRGRSGIGWFFLALALPIFAIFWLLLMPPLGGANTQNGSPRLALSRRDSSPLMHSQLDISSGVSEFHGKRTLGNPKYQLFLTRTFNIEKNSTLDKFTIKDDVYDDLDSALKAADEQYERDLRKRPARLGTLSQRELALKEHFQILETGTEYIFQKKSFDRFEDALAYAQRPERLTFDCLDCTYHELVTELESQGFGVTHTRGVDPLRDKFIIEINGAKKYAYNEKDFRKLADTILNK